jgi:DNA-directed RNA polymerase subunit RPC12/RpoP
VNQEIPPPAVSAVNSPEMPAPGAPAKEFPCRQCGGTLDYRPGTSRLKCPHCGFENSIPQSEGEVRELDYRAFLAELAGREETHETLVVKCSSCGAETTLPPNTTAAACAFCGSNLVATARSHAAIKPKAILPFKVTREEALRGFERWVRGLWFAPGELFRYAQTEGRFTGLYVPYWTYDSETTTFYRGQRGDDYWVTQAYSEMENGRMVTRTRQVRQTLWTPVQGTVWNSFDDVLVLATRSLPRSYTDRLEPWDLKDLVDYRDEYLSGFRSQSYQVSLEEGFAIARQIMEGTIRQSAQADIGGDHQQVLSMKTQYDTVTFKHVLLPVWTSAYRYRERVYRFLVNGRTGEVQGERPWSAMKIAILVVVLLALIATIAVLISQHLQ